MTCTACHPTVAPQRCGVASHALKSGRRRAQAAQHCICRLGRYPTQTKCLDHVAKRTRAGQDWLEDRRVRASGDDLLLGGEVALVMSAPARPARGQDLVKTFDHYSHAAEPL